MAHAGLADSYCILGFYTALPPGEAFPRVRQAALRALELDPKLSEARPTLAYVTMYHEWDWAEAERQFQAAIRASPGLRYGPPVVRQLPRRSLAGWTNRGPSSGRPWRSIRFRPSSAPRWGGASTPGGGTRRPSRSAAARWSLIRAWP